MGHLKVSATCAADGPGPRGAAGSEALPCRCAPAAMAPDAPRTVAFPSTREELCRLSVRELKDVVRGVGGDPAAYLEKAELVEAAWSAVGGAQAGVGGSAGTSRQVPATFVDRSNGQEATAFRADAPAPWPSETDAASAPAQSETTNAEAVLTAEVDVGEAEGAVLRHCEAAVAAVATRLERVWQELTDEIAGSECEAALAASAQARNVFELIDASLELKRAGRPAPRRVQHLAFEVSVVEEAWLVRKSILDATARGDADDIELWAEQAKFAGEDVSVELAYVGMLRWASRAEWAGIDDDAEHVEVDVGVAAAPSCRPPGAAEHAAEKAAAPGSTSAEELAEQAEEAVGGDDGMRLPPRSSCPSRFAVEVEDAVFVSEAARPARPYSASGGDLGRHGREDVGQGASGGARYNDFWGHRSEPPEQGSSSAACSEAAASGPSQLRAARPSSASAYTYSGGQLPREEVGQGTRYAGFWDGAARRRGGGEGTGEAAERPTAERPARRTDFWSGFAAAGFTDPAASGEQPPPPPMPPGVGMPPRLPGRRPQPIPSTRPPPPRGSPDGGARTPPIPAVAPSRPPPSRPERPASAPAGRPDISLDGPSQAAQSRQRPGAARRRTSPGGRRVRLVDFLQAKANEPEFLKADRPWREATASSATAAGLAGNPRAGETSSPPRQPPPGAAAAPPQSPSAGSACGHERGSRDGGSGSQPPRPPTPPAQPPREAKAKEPTPTSPPPRRQAADWERKKGSSWWGSSSSDGKKADVGRKTSLRFGGIGSFFESRDKAKGDWQKAKATKEEESQKEHEERAFWEEQARNREQRKKEKRAPKGGANPSASSDSGARAPPRRPSPPQRPRPSGRNEYLELLGFGLGADPTEPELKRAYRDMAMRWHPDRPHNREREAEATEMFQMAKEAFDYFMEEYKR